MVSEEKLRALKERKDLLIAECDLHRGIIVVELARARHSFDWMARCSETLSWVRPWIPLAAPVAGFFMARNWRTVMKWSGRTLGWKLLGRLIRF
jgi:hypothetical protein